MTAEVDRSHSTLALAAQQHDNADPMTLVLNPVTDLNT
jgi:hypothetical protein